MGVIREIRDWFFYHTTAVTDKEIDFVKQYTSGKLSGKFNVFLKGDYPSENVFKKFFKSVAFFLDRNSTAFEKKQGLVQKATDDKAYNRDSTDNGEYNQVGTDSSSTGLATDTSTGSGTLTSPKDLSSNYFATAVLPHQILKVELIGSYAPIGYIDVPPSGVVSGYGLSIQSYKRTNNTTGRYGEVLKIAANPDLATIEIDNTFLKTKGYSGTKTVVTGITVNEFGQITNYTTSNLVFVRGLLQP